MLCAVGIEPRAFVGRSEAPDHPEQADPAPVVMRPGTLTIDGNALVAARPDLIVFSRDTEDGPIDATAVRHAASSLNPAPHLLELCANSIEAVLDEMIRIGEAIGRSDRASDVVVRMRERMHAAQQHVNPFADGPNVAFLVDVEPIRIAGGWIPQLIERAGGRHPLNPTTAAPGMGTASGMQQGSRRAGPAVSVPPEVLIASRPDVMIVCPHTGTPDGTADANGHQRQEPVRALETLRKAPWFNDTPAARSGRVVAISGRATFHRAGPRLCEALEWLVANLNDRPDLSPPAFGVSP
jgi:iron complex transport system substrate-binding protein